MGCLFCVGAYYREFTLLVRTSDYLISDVWGTPHISHWLFGLPVALLQVITKKSTEVVHYQCYHLEQSSMATNLQLYQQFDL